MHEQPDVVDLGHGTPAIIIPATNLDKPVSLKLSFSEPSFEADQPVVSVAKMVNAKGNIATDAIVIRINRHMEYLSGKTGFNSEKDRHDEQVNFMETVGNSLKLDFDAYVVVTDTLMTAIRANQAVFSDGMAFRFMVGLEKRYPADGIKAYKAYIELLTKIAANWTVRYKLPKLVDVTFGIALLDRVGKTNVEKYFRKLSAV